MTLLPSFQQKFFTTLTEQPGGVDCFNEIHMHAQHMHYSSLRQLQGDIYELPYIKSLHHNVRYNGSWLTSCRRTTSAGLRIFSEYSLLLVEAQLKGSESLQYRNTLQKLGEFYGKGMLSSLYLHEGVPTPKIFGESIETWIEEYRRVICTQTFCTIHIYSSFPQYTLFKPKVSTSYDKLIGKRVPAHRHLVILKGHLRNVANGKILGYPTCLENMEVCKRLFSTISCHRIEQNKAMFDFATVESTNDITGSQDLSTGVGPMELLEKTITTTLWAENGTLDFLVQAQEEEGSLFQDVPLHGEDYSQEYSDGDSYRMDTD